MTDLKWYYSGTDGPSSWHKLCPIGEEQSPVDIVNPLSGVLPEIIFSYAEEPITLFNHNHTVKAGSFEVSCATHGGTEYRLQDIHFHSPSEHRIDSLGFPMETHLVHIGEGGEQMVIAIFIDEGEEKKDFNPLIEYFERFRLTKENDEPLLIDAIDFIPKDRAYYSYQGSHTSPPCLQGVKWLIMHDPFLLSSAGIERLRRVVGENCRPLQPLNGRVIEASS